MTYKPFSLDFINHVLSIVHQAQEETESQLFAAFDADGTLWDTDVGNLFFQYQVQHPLINTPQNLIEQYDSLYYHNPKEALMKLTLVNLGHKLSQVRQWAKECYHQHKDCIPVFTPQIDFIQSLQDLGVRIYIVTASCKWAVEPFAKIFNIDNNHVIGTETEVENNVITRRLKRLTHGEDKVKGLLQATKGVRPLLAVGNALPDESLLYLATHLRLAIQSTKDNILLYKSEQELKSIAIKQGIEKGWFHHQFYES